MFELIFKGYFPQNLIQIFQDQFDFKNFKLNLLLCYSDYLTRQFYSG